MSFELEKQLEQRMQKTVRSFSESLAKIRTGRAQPSLLDGITVLYYDVPTPINQVATIGTEDARTLTVTPFEKNMVGPVEKALRSSDLGFNPSTAGSVIRVPLPPLTQQRREELAKQVKATSEDAKIAIRQIRRDANNKLKQDLKAKTISVDEERRDQDKVQKLTDKFIHEIDNISHKKESDLTVI